MKYTVETVFPYRFFHYDTIEKAREKKSELEKDSVKSSIICVNENGNDYIVE